MQRLLKLLLWKIENNDMENTQNLYLLFVLMTKCTVELKHFSFLFLYLSGYKVKKSFGNFLMEQLLHYRYSASTMEMLLFKHHVGIVCL